MANIKLPVALTGGRAQRRTSRPITAADVPTVGLRADPGLRVPNLGDGGLEDVGAVVSQIGGQLAAAETRINKRRESNDRRADGRAYHEFSRTAFDKFSTEGDFSSEDDLSAFGAALQAERERLVSGRREKGMSEDGLGRLQDRLETTYQEWVDKGSVRAVQIQTKRADEDSADIISGLAARVGLGEDPQALIAEGMRHMEAEKDSLGPRQEIAYARVLSSRLWTAKADRFMRSGDFDAVRNMMDDPEVQRGLGVKEQRRIFDRLAAVQREQAEAATAPVKGIPRSIFDKLTPAQQSEVLGATPDEKTVKGLPGSIFDAMTDADKRQFLGLSTPEEKGARAAAEEVAELKGILGRDPTEEELQRKAKVAERGPIVSITQTGETAMAKELGKGDAKKVLSLEEDAQQAFRTLAEVDRMQAAIDSGRFTTGVFSDARVFLARLAEFVGASDKTLNLLGDAATADTLDAAANRLGVEAAQKLGRITNMSLQFVRDSLPSLVRTPEGNLILMEVMRRTSEREIKYASMANDFIQRHGSLRPKGEKTFFVAMRDLEKTDPVITEELKKRIIEGSKRAPKSFVDMFRKKKDVPTISKQEEVDALEPGAEFIWEPTGKLLRKD